MYTILGGSASLIVLDQAIAHGRMRGFDKESTTKAKTVTAEDITAQLADAVHEHRLKPGAKLRDDEVSDLFGVSRTVVRQALRAKAFSRSKRIAVPLFRSPR